MRRVVVVAVPLILACVAPSGSCAIVTTQWFMWLLSRLTAAESGADWTAETCVRMSMQHSPYEIMCCRPHTWPSMQRGRVK